MEAADALQALGQPVTLNPMFTQRNTGTDKKNKAGMSSIFLSKKQKQQAAKEAEANASLTTQAPWLESYVSVINGTYKRDFGLVNAAYDQLLRKYPKNAQVCVCGRVCVCVCVCGRVSRKSSTSFSSL